MIDTARIERQKRELALDHAAGRIGDADYLERMGELRRASPVRTTPGSVSPADAVSFLRDVAGLWKGTVSDEARAELLHGIYERIVVTPTASWK